MPMGIVVQARESECGNSIPVAPDYVDQPRLSFGVVGQTDATQIFEEFLNCVKLFDDRYAAFSTLIRKGFLHLPMHVRQDAQACKGHQHDAFERQR